VKSLSEAMTKLKKIKQSDKSIVRGKIGVVAAGWKAKKQFLGGNKESNPNRAESSGTGNPNITKTTPVTKDKLKSTDSGGSDKTKYVSKPKRDGKDSNSTYKHDKSKKRAAAGGDGKKEDLKKQRQSVKPNFQLVSVITNYTHDM
jgi:hypothetical protein